MKSKERSFDIWFTHVPLNRMHMGPTSDWIRLPASDKWEARRLAFRILSEATNLINITEIRARYPGYQI